MDDLFKGPLAMPDLIARQRHTLPDPGKDGAFMAVFTRLDVLPAIPMIDQGGAHAEMVVAMPQSLPGMVSTQHRSMPKPGESLPDASAAVSLVVPASIAAIARAQDTPMPDDSAPLVDVAWSPPSDPTMRMPNAAALSENTLPDRDGPERSVFELAVTGPVMPKPTLTTQPVAAATLMRLSDGEAPIAPAPMATMMEAPPELVPPLRDAPKAARLAVVDFGSPPNAQPKPPMAPASAPAAIMVGQGNGPWSSVPARYPMGGDLIQLPGDPPLLSDHLLLPKGAVADRTPAPGLPPTLPPTVAKSAVMVAPQTVVTKGPSDVAVPVPTRIAPDHASAPPLPMPQLHAPMPQPIATPMAHASVPDMSIALMGPRPAPSSRAVTDLAPTQPQPMIPAMPLPPRDQQTALPKQVESGVVTNPAAQAWGGAAMPANVAIPAPMQLAAPQPQTQAAQIPMALPQGMPAESVAPFFGSMPGRDMRAMGDPSDASLSLANGTAPALAVRIGPGAPDLPMLAQSASQQIVTASAQLQAELGGPIDIALDPPELGRVRLSLVEVNGVMTLSITAERPETADLMRRHLSLLADEFARQGLDAPSVDISGGGQGGRQPRDDEHTRAPEGHDHPINRSLSPVIGAPLQVAASGLDLRL